MPEKISLQQIALEALFFALISKLVYYLKQFIYEYNEYI